MLFRSHFYDYISEGEHEVEVEALKLGQLVFVGVKPELNCLTAQAIKKASPYKETLLCTLINGGAKYMADYASYERYTYEAMNSPFGKGAAEILKDNCLFMLNDMAASEV